jgi:hypothetical protein
MLAGRLRGASGGISVAGTLRRRMGGGVGCGIRRGANAFMAAATIFFFASVFTARRVAVIAAIVAGKRLDANVVLGKIGVFGKIGRADSAGFARRGAKIGKNGMLLNLTLAQCGEIVCHRFLFVESDLAGVGADETLIEDAAGKLFEVFVFEGAEHAGADLGGLGDGVEREAALLALLAKFFSERSHDWLRRTGLSVPLALA